MEYLLQANFWVTAFVRLDISAPADRVNLNRAKPGLSPKYPDNGTNPAARSARPENIATLREKQTATRLTAQQGSKLFLTCFLTCIE